MVSTGIDKDGNILHESWDKPLPKLHGEVPSEIWDQVVTDLKNLPDTDKPMKFHVRENLKLGINSEEKTLYEVVDSKKGHYLLSRVYDDGNEEQEALMANDPRNKPNPLLIVCSEEEVENWIKN